MIERDECEFECEVLASAIQRGWLDRADRELRAHVPSCSICLETAEVALAIAESRDELREAAVLPNSGRVWWMAQLRARREASEAARRPIVAAESIAFVCGIVVICGLVASSISGLHMKDFLPTIQTVMVQHGMLALALGLIVFGVPTVVYLAAGRE